MFGRVYQQHHDGDKGQSSNAACYLGTMYFDLNVPVPSTSSLHSNKKGKAKQYDTFSANQLVELEARVDLLMHCAFSHKRKNL
jgi:hypothetical protein